MDGTSLMVPPNSVEMEQALLSALIFYQEVEILDNLEPHHFYRTAHQKLFEACKRLYQKEKAIDANLLISALGSKLAEIGGASYIAKILDEPQPSDISVYCEKIKNYWMLRKIIEMSNACCKMSFGEQDAETSLNYLQTQIAMLYGCQPSEWVHINQIMDECIERCEKIQVNNGVSGVPSGFTELDRYTTGFQPGDLIVIAARPGCGKTSFAVNAAMNSAESGFKNGVMSLEMARFQIGNRLLSMVSRINGIRLRNGSIAGDEWGKLTESAGRLCTLPIWVDDGPRVSHVAITKKARILEKTSGLDILWIDYLGFVDGDKTSKSKVYEIESITRNLKALAKELQIPVVLLCQLNRQCEMRPDKRPMLSDLRDSGAIEQDADVVLFLYNDAKYNKDSPDAGVIECEIAKQRNGPTSRIKLAWIESYTLFGNLFNREVPR